MREATKFDARCAMGVARRGVARDVNEFQSIAIRVIHNPNGVFVNPSRARERGRGRARSERVEGTRGHHDDETREENRARVRVNMACTRTNGERRESGE